MIAITDYGMGNLGSVKKALDYLGAPCRITRDPQQLRQASHVILPGVGAFADAMDELERRGLVEPLKEATNQGKPFLGICLGMQMLFEGSSEGEPRRGLALLPGRLEALTPKPGGKVPHMGWNKLTFPRPHPLFAGLPADPAVYFVHTYAFLDTQAPFAAALSDHGAPFVAAIARGNLMATQFHPEKSGAVGLKILANFAAMTEKEGPYGL